MNTVLQTTFTQRVIFGDPPPHHIRRALKQAGFRFRGAYWEHSTGTAGTIGHGYLMEILNMANIRATGIAPPVTT